VEINNRVKETKDPEYEEPESDESDQGSQTNHHDRNDQYYYEHPNNVQDPRRHAYGQQGYDPSRRFYNGQNSNDQHQMYHPNYSNVPYPRQGPPYGYEQQRNIPYSDQYYPQRGVPPEYQPTHYPHPQATDVRQDVSHRPPPAIPGTSVPSSDEINEPGDLDHDKAVGTVTDDKPVTENPAIDDAQPLNPQVPLTDGKVGLEDQLFAFAPGSTNERPVEMHLQSLDQTLIFEGLKRLYRKKILPLELSSKYGHFHSPPLSPSDFDARPMVLLLGQYSVGKTSFVRYLLGRDFPGIRIGPEPTTDRFTIIMDGQNDKIIPGAALCAQGDRPFRGLSPFGNNFLSRLEGVEMHGASILQNVTLVDTPGILSGQKQRLGRNYDYEQVMKWFAERADLIIIMFDAHKLDISDELKRVIELMIPHADKIRVLLNKADQVSTQQLMRVYGALMWSLGKVMNTPEVSRVFIGSFWENPLAHTEQADLFQQEQLDLLHDIRILPANAVMRRINELVKRARSVKVHAYIIHYLRKQLPYTFGKREKQQRLINRLDREFVMCARRYELPKGDFPPLEPFRQALLEIKDLSEFSKLDKRMVKEMEKVFSVDIPELLERARNH